MRDDAQITFERDYKKLKKEHQRVFLELRSEFLEEFERVLLSTTQIPAPRKFRLKELKNTEGIWAMTWSFSRPAGRATFHIEEHEGEPILVWRRIGTHEIYREP